MSKTKKIIIALICIFITILGIIYFIGIAYFQTHLKIGTNINGYSCSFKTWEEAASLLEKEVDNYAIAVNTRNNGVEKVASKDISMVFNGQNEIKNILNKQNYYLWFIPEIGEKRLSEDCYSIDYKTAEKFLDTLKCMNNMVKGQTAAIVETNGYYQVSPGVKGTDLDTDKAKAVIESAMRQWKKSVNLEDAGCYIDADMADEDELQKQCDFLNSIQETILTLDFGDRVEKITMDVIKQQLLNENYMLTKDSVTPYVQNLASKYDTVGLQRKFITYNDRTALIAGGDYGWKMNIDKTAEKLVELINNDTIEVVDAEYDQEAVSRDTNDIKYSYIEIDTSNRTLVLYINGTPTVQTQIHLGSNITPGFYKITTKGNDTIAFGQYSITQYVEMSSGFSGTADISSFSANSIGENCIGISDAAALTNLLTKTDMSWPVVVYNDSNVQS